MDLGEIIKAGVSGLAYTAFGIAFVIMVGLLLGRLLRVRQNISFLIASGTAICGGSAIAALGPVVGANDDDMSVSLGTVFILNSVALLIFPAIGAALGLTQRQFGLWSALAIHDTSSVVGAAAKYGTIALLIATTVKLTRALWIAPLCILIAAVKGCTVRIAWPWFIPMFVAAAIFNSTMHSGASIFHVLAVIGRTGLTATLFLIGAGMSRQNLRAVGLAPFVQGTVLWIVVAMVSLVLIRFGLLAL